MFSSHFATYTLGAAYDEMFGAGGVARSHYELLSDRLQQLRVEDLHQRQATADLAFLNQGITFTVYGQGEGTERIFPYDLIPRLYRRRVGRARSRAHAADHRAQPVQYRECAWSPGAWPSR